MHVRRGEERLRVLVHGGDGLPALRERLEAAGIGCEPVADDGPDAPGGRPPDAADLPPLLVLLERAGDLEPLRRVRRRLPHHPLVAVTLEGTPPSLDAARRLGADGTLGLDGASGSHLADLIVAAVDRRRLVAKTERLAARLEAAGARFRNTVQRVADGILILDAEGRLCFVNAAAERLFGRGRDELIGQEFGFPVTVGETTEIELLPPGGEPVVAELRVTETEWEDEPCLLVSLRDVTRQRRVEERERDLIREQSARREAEASSERNEFLAEASRSLYSSLDSEEVLATLADLVLERMGDACVLETLVADMHLPEHRSVKARREVAGQPAVALLREAPATVLGGPAADRVIDGGEAVCVGPGEEGAFDDPELARRLEEHGVRRLLLNPLTVGEKTVGVLGVLDLEGERPVDGRERAVVDELVRRAGLALENARLFRLSTQASQAKSDFLNVVSHELRTPLTGIMGYAGLLTDGIAGPLDESHLQYLEGIERNSEQLLRIIDQILLFADTEGERQDVRYVDEPLRALVEDVVSLARPMAERQGLEFRTDVPGEDVRVRMDAPKVRQIVLHLLSNAVKFTREGWVELRVRPGADRLTLEVADSGIGIPTTHHGRVFDAFTQVESSQTRVSGGTGIGLNVVKNLTQLLGGSIHLSSEPGEGSIFTVELPVPSPSGAAEREREGRA